MPGENITSAALAALQRRADSLGHVANVADAKQAAQRSQPRPRATSRSIRPEEGFQSHGPSMKPGLTIVALKPRAISSRTTCSASRLVTT